MTELSVMTIPSEGTDGLAVRMLVYERGVWRETQPPPGTDLKNMRMVFSRALVEAVSHPSAAGGDAVTGLIGPGIALFRDLIPPDLEEILANARRSTDGERPLLRIHLSPAHEWIPWEVLNDGHDFLGLNFQIARLPIVQQPPLQPENAEHLVERVNSLLGRRVADPPDEDFDRWRETFNELLPQRAQALVPPTATDEGWPRVMSLMDEADIVHVTCHGERDEAGPYWTLDPDKPKATHRYTLSSELVTMLGPRFEERKPLVFGNACTTDQAMSKAGEPDRPALATAFFRNNALNFVGSLAPIRRPLAVRFARLFYEELLRERKPISLALLDAKRRCQKEEPAAQGDPTYLFYCLYGPPETRYLAPHENGNS